jgi:protein O-GlcNAc transferase
MKKVISFSLWGDSPIYNIGAIRNAELAKEIYPGWICRFYYDTTTPLSTIEKLNSFNNVELVSMGVEGDWTGMFWRFFPASDIDVDVVIVRDCDSRLNIREKLAVDEWLISDKGFHIMRDHPAHVSEILGGMWGSKRGVISNMKELVDDYLKFERTLLSKGNFWQVDQNFLKEKIFPLVCFNSMVHDEYYQKKPFPAVRQGKTFVGQAFNEKDEMLHPDHVNRL